MATRIPPVAQIGWGGSGINDSLKRLLAKMALGVNIPAPAAKSTTGRHAALAGTAAVAFPGPFTQPAANRNATATFAASYDGGNINLVGLDDFGQPQTETLVAVAASTVVGVKVWSSITSASRTVVGVNAATVSLGTGDKLGLGVKVSAGFIVGTKDGVAELMVLDAANAGVTPTTVPNGAVNYNILVNPE